MTATEHQPSGYVYAQHRNDTEADMRARWLPTPEQIRAAVEELRRWTALHPAVPAREWIAAVALIMPGKEHGWWTIGQPVEPVEGVWVGRNAFDCEWSYADARADACKAAWEALGDRPGTVAWATVSADGHAAVFEDFAPPGRG